MARSFLIEAEREVGTECALEYVRDELLLAVEQNPDVSVLSYAVLTADDAREVLQYASQTSLGGKRALIVACDRIFHEAQNALLKIFEEPPEDMTLFLVVPSRAQLLPTMLSRLSVLEADASGYSVSDIASDFMNAGKPEREKMIAKLLAQIKSDNEETKQEARSSATLLLGGIIVLVHKKWEKTQEAELRTLLRELVEFHALLRGRSAPYKLIFEHVLLTLPQGLE